jgi:hypothetical protein
LFSAAGPSLALFWVTQKPIEAASAEKPIQTVSADDAFDRLERNDRVEWLIRLISYDPKTDPQLSIHRLTRLGPPKQQYSFVAAYDELIGFNVTEALRMIGGSFTPGHHVSAIIFPRTTQLYPASARGLLQVVQHVENRKDVDIVKPFIVGRAVLNEGELAELKEDSLPSYRFSNYRHRYRSYCELAQELRCDGSYSVRDYIGELSIDWTPLGYAQRDPEQHSCS